MGTHPYFLEIVGTWVVTATIIKRCWSMNPDERPTADDVLKSLLIIKEEKPWIHKDSRVAGSPVAAIRLRRLLTRAEGLHSKDAGVPTTQPAGSSLQADSLRPQRVVAFSPLTPRKLPYVETKSSKTPT